MNSKRLNQLTSRLYSKVPLIGALLQRHAARTLAKETSPKTCAVLATALTEHRDHQVLQIASEFIDQLNSRACIDAVCEIWADTRHKNLEKIILSHGWLARKPSAARVLTSLKLGRTEPVIHAGAELVLPLIEACRDSDPEIARQAQATILQLQNSEAQDEVCHIYIEHNDLFARQAAEQSGYLPKDAHQRALFFFLTDSWESYQALDFDRRLLRTAYEAANPELRQRVTERIRATGRVDFLTVITGGESRERIATMTSDEIHFLVQMLVEKQAWEELWKRAFELTFSASLQIVKALSNSAWKPSHADERSALRDLTSLANSHMETHEASISRQLPAAIQRSRARVSSGRVNDIAFASHQPMIAVGTSQRQVALWNFQSGKTQKVLNGFAHSIGRLAFTHDEALIFGERTTGEAPCATYFWREGRPTKIWQHKGSVTAIKPLIDSQALVAGRDGKVVILDLGGNRRVAGSRRFQFWARNACVAGSGQHAALLHYGSHVVSLPRLEIIASDNNRSRGVARSAAFSPDSSALIIGKFNGEVRVFKGHSLVMERPALTWHHDRVEGVDVSTSRSLVITIGSKGEIHFTAWPERISVAKIQIPGKQFTSLHISPDESFMAIGDSDASISLWDLRILDVPLLFSMPLIKSTPNHLAAVNTLIQNGSLPAEILQSLRFVERILRHRFRYEIEIEQLPTIKMGEYEIEIV